MFFEKRKKTGGSCVILAHNLDLQCSKSGPTTHPNMSTSCSKSTVNHQAVALLGMKTKFQTYSRLVSESIVIKGVAFVLSSTAPRNPL